MKKYTSIILLFVVCIYTKAADVGKRFQSEKNILIDKTSGVPITVFTRAKWVAADNFGSEVYLANCPSVQRKLLTENNKMKYDHIHPSFSPYNTRIIVQSRYVSDGKKLGL